MDEVKSAGAQPDGAYEIVIAPGGSLFRMNWRELWEYRDLLRILVRRDYLSKYKQTVLGPIWFVLQPLLMAVVFAAMFKRVAKLETDGIPGLLFYLCNMLPWTYFAQNITTGAATFTTNAHLFGKVYFPRLVVPLASLASNLVAFGLSLATFAAFWVYYRFFVPGMSELAFGWGLAWLPVLIVQCALFGLGVSLCMAASTARYRDLIHVLPLVVQVWMLASVTLPLSEFPPRWQWLIWVNPMAVVVEGFRIALLGRGTMQPGWALCSAAVTVAVLAAGLVLFRRAERTVVDTV